MKKGGEEKRLLITIFLNLIITITEAIGGIFAGSLSLLSDALHNLSDAVSGTTSFLALRISKRKHTPKMTFGYRRSQILAALFNSVILIAIVVFLFREAYVRLIHPLPIDSQLMFFVAFIGLVANAVSTSILRKDARNNINIKSAYLHLFADALSSIAIITGSIFIYLLGFYWIDAVLTIAIGIYIIKETYGILKDSITILMEATPSSINIDEIRKEIEGMKEVRNLHHVHIWQIDDRNINFEGHIDLCDDIKISEADMIRNKIEKILKKYGITHATIQMEYNACEDKDIIKQG